MQPSATSLGRVVACRSGTGGDAIASRAEQFKAQSAHPPSIPDTSKAERTVPRRVKDFIEISDYTSLDALIRYLETIRDNLPAEHEAELQIRGDEVFGRRLTITYFREQTPDEAELEARYAGSEANDEAIEQLQRQLDEVPFEQRRSKGQ